MKKIQVGKIYSIVPISVILGNVTLLQDKVIEIIEIKENQVTYWYSGDGKVYTNDIFSIQFIAV